MSLANTRFYSEWEEVIAENEKIVDKKTSEDLIAHYKLGVAYANLGEIEKSVDVFKAIQDEDYLNELRDLIINYRIMLRREPDNIKAINYLAFAYYIAHMDSEAKEMFEQLIELDPENIWVYNYLAIVNQELENYQETERNLRTALEIKDNEYSHFLLGVNYYRQGDLVKANYYMLKGRRVARTFFNL
ncbi:tetratricopeptide repeat protein [Natroniella sulfidigena]|uniref:tetratricopeptide repeat protein n=1 Tax=Natroniella sulfidigena TaxID=723921 RepID=UPI00200AFF5A|nr:tetratricopeptide repeat protein [Natroniella sulfidigena]MCK8817695.1 tetratricopeptide repeat protein [Natroniella sulfidigena]